MKKKIAAGLVLLLLLALLGWAFAPTPVEVELSEISQGRFERTVQEDGKTRVRDRYMVSAPLAGRVARIDLVQGDRVEQGAVLATVWPAAPALLDERARAEQIARVAVVRASVARSRVNVERAGVALEQARIDLQRNQALAAQGFVSPTQLETVLLNLRLREKERESAQREEEAAQYELVQAQAALAQFSQPTAPGAERVFSITAPVAGTVLKVVQQSEAMVLPGTALLELGNPRDLEVVVDVLTQDAAQITPGTTVQLSNWGGAAVLEGRVRRVEPAAFTKVSALGVEEQRVNTVVDITSPFERWSSMGDGFKVDVRVLVQVEERALKVPVSALFPLGTRSALFVVEAGRARQREVEVLARNGVEAWIRTSLPLHTPVIVYPDTALRDGARVQQRSMPG